MIESAIQTRVTYSENVDSVATAHEQSCGAALSMLRDLEEDANRQVRELYACLTRLGIKPNCDLTVLARICPEYVQDNPPAQTSSNANGERLSDPVQSNGHRGRKPARK